MMTPRSQIRRLPTQTIARGDAWAGQNDHATATGSRGVGAHDRERAAGEFGEPLAVEARVEELPGGERLAERVPLGWRQLRAFFSCASRSRSFSHRAAVASRPAAISFTDKMTAAERSFT
jgi:hypothetical protein